MQNNQSCAVVLGGGGTTGIAWEIGILTGLSESNISLSHADKIIGTSAGSFVGVALASGYSIENLFQKYQTLSGFEIDIKISKRLYLSYILAYLRSLQNKSKLSCLLGKISQKNPEPIPRVKRMSVIKSRLVTQQWPKNLVLTTIDADSGELVLLDASSNWDLIDAVAASAAVPGLWPIVRKQGKIWLDGGMYSTSNALLAQNYSKIVIIAPMPKKMGFFPSIYEDLSILQKHSNVILITPNAQSRKTIGSNPFDLKRCPKIVEAGKQQGIHIANEVQTLLSSKINNGSD